MTLAVVWAVKPQHKQTVTGQNLAQRANATVSDFGNIVVRANAFAKLFSKTNYPVIKASYGISFSTVSIMGTKKHAVLSR